MRQELISKEEDVFARLDIGEVLLDWMSGSFTSSLSGHWSRLSLSEIPAKQMHVRSKLIYGMEVTTLKTSSILCMYMVVAVLLALQCSAVAL
jgi:hypothetical protein